MINRITATLRKIKGFCMIKEWALIQEARCNNYGRKKAVND